MAQLERYRPFAYGQEGDGPSSDEIISGGPPEGRSDEDERLPIGVPEDWSVEMRSGYPWAVGGPNTTVAKKPLYFDGDEYDPARGSPESIAMLQRKMAEAGILTSPFRLGYWDGPSTTAYAKLLGFANTYGVHASLAVEAWKANPPVEYDPETGQIVDAGAELRERAPLVTRTTDPAILGNVFREAVINIAGEGWDQRQIQSAVRAYNLLERQRQKEMYDAQVVGGNVQDIPAPADFIEARVRQEDPDRVAAETGLGYIGEFEQLLAQWGPGGGLF